MKVGDNVNDANNISNQKEEISVEKKVTNYEPISHSYQKRKNFKTAFIFLIFLIVTPLIVLFLISFFSINKHEYKNRTFMIYMVGSDLETDGSIATYDLKDIIGKNIDLENNNVILMVGGSKKWHNFVNEDELGLYELTKSGFKKEKSYELSNMGEADTLSSFLKYTYNIYPSDKYDLIFWNHGLGSAGLEIDEISDDYIDTYELKKVFENSPFSNEKLELVIFNKRILFSEMQNYMTNFMCQSKNLS